MSCVKHKWQEISTHCAWCVQCGAVKNKKAISYPSPPPLIAPIDSQELTIQQQKVLTFINNFINKNGFPPTFREIGAALKIKSTNGVNDHLKALETKGYIKRSNMKSRTIIVVKT